MPEEDPDLEIERLRRKADRDDRDKVNREKQRKKEKEDARRKEDDKKKKYDSMKDKHFTYDFKGKVIPIQSIRPEALPEIASRCQYVNIYIYIYI